MLAFLLVGSARTLQLRLSFFVCSILDKPSASLAAALQLDASLLRNLVQLLLPPLHAAAAAMQLPADRRPSELSWSLVSSITRGLRSETLSQAFKEQQAVATTGDSSYAPRMLQTTAQLFAAAPGSCPDTFVGDNERAGLWLSLLWLLNVGTCLVRCRAQPQAGGAALPEALRQQMARQLLQASCSGGGPGKGILFSERCDRTRESRYNLYASLTDENAARANSLLLASGEQLFFAWHVNRGVQLLRVVIAELQPDLSRKTFIEGLSDLSLLSS